jgi:hypothetical protein
VQYMYMYHGFAFALVVVIDVLDVANLGPRAQGALVCSELLDEALLLLALGAAPWLHSVLAWRGQIPWPWKRNGAAIPRRDTADCGTRGLPSAARIFRVVKCVCVHVGLYEK